MRRSLSLGLVALVALGLGGCLFDPPPVVVLRAPTISGPAPLEVIFDLSYCDDPNGHPLSYSLDFGDGSESRIGDDFDFGVVVRHTYETSGSFSVRLTVTNAQGKQGKDDLTVTVSQEGPPVGLVVDSTAPDFTAHRTDGGTATLSDFRGKVVLLEFWGAWCAPCRGSMPRLADLAEEFANQGLVVIAVSTDTSEQDAVDSLAQNGYTRFVSVWEPGGKSGSPLTQLYGVATSLVGIPRTFVLDRQGVIRYVGHPNELSLGLVESLL